MVHTFSCTDFIVSQIKTNMCLETLVDYDALFHRFNLILICYLQMPVSIFNINMFQSI